MKDHFSKYFPPEEWCIREENFNQDLQKVRESQLALGNGYLGSRAALEEKPMGAQPGTFIAGIYDRLTSQVAEMVNFPNPFSFKLSSQGEKFGMVAMDVIDHHRTLNMRDGLLLRRTIYTDVKNRRYDYQSMRFLSMDNKNLGAMQIVFTPLDDDMELHVQTAVDTGVYNQGVATEGNKKHFHLKELSRIGQSRFRLLETLEKHHYILFQNGLYYQIGNQKIYTTENVLQLNLKKHQSVTFTLIFYIQSTGPHIAVSQVKKETDKVFQKALHSNFGHLVSKHITAWNKLWDVADIEIGNTSDIQKNVRFNLYHKLICGHFDEGFSSIGARTLSGEGYRGHIFWDAEIFLLPFYAYVSPKVAKNMLLYRYYRLNQAKKIAKEMGYEGAMFPWESAESGEEETPTWAKDLDGTIIRIRTNELEHHITADIAYACDQYVSITNDKEFMVQYGYEMIFESARFWASRVKKNRKGQYEIRDVIGPDEFHEHVDNNAYTNCIARWNLWKGHELYHELKKKKNKKTFQELIDRCQLSDEEVEKWSHIASRIGIKVRKDKVIEQFDGFSKKKYIELTHCDENNIPLLPEDIEVKDYNKTQLVKQADVLMLLVLFPEMFDQETKESNYWYYSKRTLHKSSLSPAMHCLSALSIDQLSEAYRYFNVALRADISNLHGNTAEGIHAASLGGVWQCVANGFAGVRRKEDYLSINPLMPNTWDFIKLSIYWQGNLCRIMVKNKEVRLKIESRKQVNVHVEVFGKKHTIHSMKEYKFTRAKKEELENYYL